MRLDKATSAVIVLVAILVASGALLWAHIRTARGQQANASAASQTDEETRDALRRGGFKEAARIKGHYTGSVNPDWDWVVFDLESLTKASSAVVVGTPIRSEPTLSTDGSVLSTVYDVKVEELIKGRIENNHQIRVGIPGGKINFKDGTSAEVTTPGFEPMQNGLRYVLFLYANRNGSDVFILTGGPEGLFELLSPDGKVKPHGRVDDPLVRAHMKKGTDEFLKEVRTHAKKWPEPSLCCN